jgi:hypothetical protein
MSKNAPMTRKECLDAAAAAVLTDRNLDYGNPEDNFWDIAAIWTIQLGNKLRSPITPAEVAALCIGIKMSRLKTSPRVSDHWVDIAGYAACGASCKNLDDDIVDEVFDGALDRKKEEDNG